MTTALEQIENNQAELSQWFEHMHCPREKGRACLRPIKDTDRTRLVKDAVDNLLQSLAIYREPGDSRNRRATVRALRRPASSPCPRGWQNGSAERNGLESLRSGFEK